MAKAKGNAARKADPVSAKDNIELNAKMLPAKGKARDTFEAIVETAGNLLGEVGFERLSTNMICDRLGISPPALYRYFPNKYAILKEMGERLMSAQDEVVLNWFEEGGLTGTLEERRAKDEALYHEVLAATLAVPGGEYISRVMRAVPVMQQARIQSSQFIADRMVTLLQDIYPTVPAHRLAAASRLSTEAGHAAIEAVIEQPELADALFAETARMIIAYFDTLADD